MYGHLHSSSRAAERYLVGRPGAVWAVTRNSFDVDRSTCQLQTIQRFLGYASMLCYPSTHRRLGIQYTLDARKTEVGDKKWSHTLTLISSVQVFTDGKETGCLF